MLCELGTREIKNSTTCKWHRYTDDGNLTELMMVSNGNNPISNQKKKNSWRAPIKN